MKLFSYMSDLSLRKKLILAFLVILLWLAAINCIHIYLFFGYIRQYNSIVETITLTNSINGVLKQKLNDEIRDIAYGKLLFENEDQYDYLRDMYQNLDKIELNDQNMDFPKEIQDVRTTLITTNEYIDKLGIQIQGNAPADERNITYEYITILSGLIDEKVQSLLQKTLAVKEESQNQILFNLKRDIIIYISLFIAAVLLSLLFALYISGSFVKPIHSLVKKSTDISEGNLTVGKIETSSKNEIGDLCRSYNRMFYNLKELILSVRQTNDLVVSTSKDIHQSILENRLAGEEVAEATQAISINLHKQDDLIKKSAAIGENLFQKFNEFALKTNSINLHSNDTVQIADLIDHQLNNYIEYFEKSSSALQGMDQEIAKMADFSEDLHEQVKITQSVISEMNLLTLSLLTKIEKNVFHEIEKEELGQIKKLSNESVKMAPLFEKKLLSFLNKASSINMHAAQSFEDNLDYRLKSRQIKNDFQEIRSIRYKQQLEIESIKLDIQDSFDQMVLMRHAILEIENNSKINKEKVVEIAAMGEEQLTTLEEVADASYKLVERIQKMKDDISQFTI
ncbi:HAMP domain-containing protein [Domibacillus indicus]|uniref:HAMP domain-containing protein n=1 Tax=Domibacillus indicus TaxID=1437523 RepID=UPI000617E292|nr:methyl-accepting chemotaxis protein [Domibacillus indicus]